MCHKAIPMQQRHLKEELFPQESKGKRICWRSFKEDLDSLFKDSSAVSLVARQLFQGRSQKHLLEQG